MPDRRTHRGPDPEDASLFGPRELERLRRAAEDLVWLLNRGYAVRSALKLVGDRHGLRARQRLAVLRSSCSDEARERRRQHQVDVATLAEAVVAIDGFNLLATIEAAIGGAPLLEGRDGCLRDVAGIHGSYRAVAETRPAIEAIGALLDKVGVADVLWLLDSPVSNSGRLGATLRQIAGARGWPWRVELLFNPDRALRETSAIVATADGPILDNAAHWANLARAVVEHSVPEPWIVSFVDPDRLPAPNASEISP